MCAASSGKRVLIGRKGRTDRVDIARSVLHLDVAAEHAGDLVPVGEALQPGGAPPVGGPAPHGQHAGYNMSPVSRAFVRES
jgi:hypothetical protein